MSRKQVATDSHSGIVASAWPSWARRLATVLLLFHMTAVVAAALGVQPSSLLEQTIAEKFSHYYELTDQGYAYRFYAPEPPPTPVLVARLEFSDGRREELRLPDHSLWPRLRYQRHLALANSLFVEFEEARRADPNNPRSRWGESYARHLCKTRGAARVTLFTRMHLIPDPSLIRDALSRGASAVNLDAEEFYTTPERIGDYSCDAF